MSYAERNRHLKKTIEAAFGRGKVTVRGSRGTAYGWVTVHSDMKDLANLTELATLVSVTVFIAMLLSWSAILGH